MRISDLAELSGLSVALVYQVAAFARERANTFGRPRMLSHLREVLLVLVWLRLGSTEAELALFFGVSQPTVHRIIHRLLPRISQVFQDSEPVDSKEHLLLDGTLVPLADHSHAAYCRIRRRAVNIQVVTDVRKQVLFVSEAWGGNRHDITMAKEVLPNWDAVYKTDGGYRSVPNCILPPKCNPKALYRHRKIRSRVEHVLARLKDWRILRQCRIRGGKINQVIKAIAGLYNLKNSHTQLLMN